ncbi:MAG: DUF4126 domain-containing protein [Phycisphaerales bacterium]
METLSAICLGLALATACGMRVFLPLLALSAGVKMGLVSPSESFAWVGNTPVVMGLAIAAAVEVLGYFLPWVDHALDVIATPLAAVAGTLAAATQLVGIEHVDPMLGWAGSVLGGGGLATLTQGATVLTRAASTTTTLGFANPVVAAAETTGALTLSVAAVVLPIAGVLMVGAAGFLVWRWVKNSRAARANAARKVPCVAR